MTDLVLSSLVGSRRRAATLAGAAVAVLVVLAALVTAGAGHGRSIAAVGPGSTTSSTTTSSTTTSEPPTTTSTSEPAAEPAPPITDPVAGPAPTTTTVRRTAPSPTSTSTPAGDVAAASSPQLIGTTWRLSTYYTAVESYHAGSPLAVVGCLVQDCTAGGAPLGTYPSDFVQAVKNEGTGRITSGEHAGQYLNWSSDVGYWLDSVPADSSGRRLVPFRSAASDALAQGTRFVVAGCGTQGRQALASAACSRISDTTWEIRDEFTPGLGGAGHVDLYIGEEDRPNFEATSPLWFDVSGATLRTA
jgi:hypothetical protein